MFGKIVKLLLLLLVCAVILNAPDAIAAKLAAGEYAVTNGSFEDTNSITGSGWSQWPGDALNYVTINTDSQKAYYGNNSAALYRDANTTILYQDLAVVDASSDGPHAGDTPEAGVWVMFDAAAASNEGQVSIEIKSIVTGNQPVTIAVSDNIDSKDPNRWYYLLTDSNTASAIPANADAIQITIASNVDGTVYVDFAQIGVAGSITGNPSKLAIIEYQTWFDVPEFIPDSKRFAEDGYTGFGSYNVHDWTHWEWGWDPDGGYTSDPAFYRQLGIKEDHVYEMINNGFEDPCYANALEEWRRFPEPNDGNYPNSINARTDEEAFEGNYSLKFTNPQVGAAEVWAKQWIECRTQDHIYPNVPNENEMVYASAMVNFDDANLAPGGENNDVIGCFWIEVKAYHDPDFNDLTQNNKWTLISKSYEHISPEYIEQNADPNGWVKIQTRPVNKGVMPWWTYGIEVSFHFWYEGTLYIDKVEVGEAEYSNVERQIACDKTPIIGPYISDDNDLIDYHLDLCQAMLFDSVLVNYYGNNYNQENYQKVAFEKMAQKIDARDMKICAFYEPKVHLKGWGDPNYYSYMEDMNDITDINAIDTARVNAYIDDVTAYNSISEMNDINEVKHYIKMAFIQEDIEYLLQNWGSKKCYLTYRGEPIIAIFGIYASKYDDKMEYQDWADILANLTTHDESYNFIFIGDSVPGDWSDYSEWFDSFTGMMNWYLVDDIVRDRKYPSRQDIYERSRDTVNQTALDWKDDGQNRFAIGVTYPQFNDQGVGAWGPLLAENADPTLVDSWKYYVNRTPTWNGDFYKKNNQGLMYHNDDIDWFVVATFNDWNEGSTIEPSVEDGYLYPIITQDFIEEFKGIPAESNDLMQQITEKYINSRVHMDVGTGTNEKDTDPTGYTTYFRVSIHQYNDLGYWIGEFVMPDLNWISSEGTLTSSFTGCDPDMVSYVPCIRLSTTSGKGWVKVDSLSAGNWTEDFSTDSNWDEYETTKITSDGSVATIRDEDGSGNLLWIGQRVSYSSGDTMTMVVDEVYDGGGFYYSGAACLQTVLNYEGFNTYTQDSLHNYASSQNLIADGNLLDAKAMYSAMNHYELDSHYNYTAQTDTTLANAYKTLCFWMTYSVPNVSLRPEKMPAIIPLNGDYKSWVVVNGLSITGDDPQTASTAHASGIEYTVNGFWITDPDINGLGKNSYITASALADDYVVMGTNDNYDGYYVSIAEPPLTKRCPTKVNIAKPKAYKNFKARKNTIVAAALKGLADNVPQTDKKFKSSLKSAVAQKPILSKDGKCYIVPFKKDGGCTTSITIDAKSGAFRKASYSKTPDKNYLKKIRKNKRLKNRPECLSVRPK